MRPGFVWRICALLTHTIKDILNLLLKVNINCYLYSLTTSLVNIDFKLLSLAFQRYIREKATKSNGTILYKKGNQLIEENPGTSEKKILKEYPHS